MKYKKWKMHKINAAEGLKHDKFAVKNVQLNSYHNVYTMRYSTNNYWEFMIQLETVAARQYIIHTIMLHNIT